MQGSELPTESEGEQDSPEVNEAELGEPASGSAHESRQPVDESLIEATLRRIEAQQAARADVASVDASAESADAPTEHEFHTAASIEATLDAVSEPRGAVDESAIEATLRRIEAQQAERATVSATPEHHRADAEALFAGASWEQVTARVAPRARRDAQRAATAGIARRCPSGRRRRRRQLDGAGQAPKLLVTKPQAPATVDDELGRLATVAADSTWRASAPGHHPRPLAANGDSRTARVRRRSAARAAHRRGAARSRPPLRRSGVSSCCRVRIASRSRTSDAASIWCRCTARCWGWRACATCRS